MMIEAARTSASPAAIWTICVVAVACLAFWLSMIWYADRHPYVRHQRLPDMPGPVLGGIHLAEGGRSVAPNRELPADLTPPAPQIPAQRSQQAPPEPAPAGAPAEPAAAKAPATAPGPPAAGEPTAAGAGTPTAAQVPAGAGAPPGPIPAQRTASGGTAPTDTTAEAPTEPIPAQRTQSADADATADHPAGSGTGGQS